MLIAGMIIVGLTILFMLGWIIALLVARKNQGWIYAPYERKEPDAEIYRAAVSITPRPPIDPET